VDGPVSHGSCRAWNTGFTDTQDEETRMKLAPRSRVLLSAAGVAAGLLAACGGGSDAPATVDVATTVLDGAIRNALVCLDKNDNGACDAGEPSARSDAAGAAVLKAAPDDAGGKYPLIALVGTDAVDADHGPVTQPFVLRAPADSPALITPLTTLVKAQVDATGLTTSEVDQSLRATLGVDASLLSNYAQAGGGAPSTTLATLARLVALIQQQAADELKANVGTPDTSGATMTSDDLARAVDRQVVLRLQDVAAALTSDAVRNAGDAAQLDAALSAAAAQLVASEVDFDPAVVVGVAKLLAGPPAASPTGDTASLRWFTYTDAANWYFRVFESTAAQNTPDSNGNRHFTDKRKRNVAGTLEVWGTTPSFTMNNVYWNGTQWFACTTDFEHPVTLVDADGDFVSRYCGAIVARSRRVEQDVSGRPLADVVRQIRASSLLDAEGDYRFWGPDPANPALAGLSFPSGSSLSIYTRTDLAQPETYTATTANRIALFAPAVAAGDPAACTGTLTTSPATTLEETIARLAGTPCVFVPNASTGPRNEGWWQSTVGLGSLVGAPNPLPFYSANRLLRASFGANQSVTYYDCAQRASNSATLNCDAIGTGSYTIETLGDARVLRFAGLPAQTAPLASTRILVERGGSVWLGFVTKPRHDYSQRLNAVAADALFAPLGIVR
jgi:hypothetical protein